MPRRSIVAIITAIYRLAISRGKGIAGIASASGQSKVKIALRAFYKYHEEETGYNFFTDILKDLTSEDLEELRTLGIEFVSFNNDQYLEIPVSLLRDPEKLREMMENER